MTQPPQTPWTPRDPADGTPPEDSVAEHRQPAGSTPAPSPARGRRRRRRRWPWVLGLLALLLAATVVLAGWYAVSLGRVYDEQRNTVDTGALDDAGSGPMNILLLGSDSRSEEEGEDAGDGRSDTMMLVHLPADREHVYIMSILRDTWVEIPGRHQDKVNAAFAMGGYPLAVDTVEQLMGVPVHHLMEVDFQGFRGVTDALGGVKVCNPTAFSSGQTNPSYFPRGEILLQDTAALRYVRERHAFEDGDITRVENQQRYVGGALGRFLSPEILANPGRTSDVVSVLSRHLSVDDGLDAATVASLAWQLREVGREDVEMFSVPIAGFGRSPGGQSILELDPARMDSLRSALAADDVQRYIEAEEAARSRRAAEKAAEASASQSASSSSTTAEPSPSSPSAPSSSAPPAPSPAVPEEVCGG